jgi:MFS family permease
VGRHQAERRRGLLREARRFRFLWLSRTISATGIGGSRVALVLLATPAGAGAVSLVLLASTLPQLLGPLAGAVADRVDQRRLLAGCECGQGLIFALIAVFRPPVPLLLPLVALAGLAATLFSPAGKSSVPRLVPADRLPRANALLGAAFNLQVMAGPAAGGLLAGLAGPSAAFGATAGSFFISALLLTRLGRLPPAASGSAELGGLLAQTWAGLRYVARSAVPRALVLATVLFVSFASMDNVALVFLVERTLRGSPAQYGITVAAYGAGMLAASLALAVLAERRTPRFWLAAGFATGAAGTVGTGLAGSIGLAAAAQALAGAGNTADLVGTDTLIQQVVPPAMLGRVFGALATAAQAGAGIAYAAAAPVVVLTGPRTTFLIAGAGMLAGLLVLVPALRAASPRPGPDAASPGTDPVIRPGGPAPAARRSGLRSARRAPRRPAGRQRSPARPG